ncbi:ABC transporter substrate-binding protein [Inquilinus sp. CAU 1745]|uniref:ABC transporter substrate-binding protein n=1 Tax=Inquilinus sp. CAU 1745 TaxID=3140369 RepID=UPI00325BE425
MTRRYGALAALMAASMAVAMPVAAQDNAITIVLPEQPDNLEPCQSLYSNIGRVLSQNVTETLTYLKVEDGTVEPQLATSWERLDDTTWRFELRDGVKFHDGADFNAEAVAFSIDRQMSGDITCDNNTKLGGLTLETEIVDENTIDLITGEPVPILPTLLNLVMMVSPNTPADQATNEPVGTGPYTLETHTPEEIVLTRFDGYWGDAPAVSEARYVWRSESALRAAMVETGEADLTPDIAIQDATNPETDFPYLNSETTRMRINTQEPPLDDVRVRKALNLSIDWEGLGLLFGPDVIRAAQLVVPGINGHNPDIEPWAYDPEEAARLLEEARADGAPLDTEITIIARNGIYPNGNEAMEAMAAMWEAAGFNMNLSILDVAAWVEYLNKPFPEDRGAMLLQEQHNNISGDAYSTAFLMYHSDGQTSTISNPELDSLLDEAAAATDEERTQLLQQVFAKVHDNIVPDMPMFHMFGYARVGERLDWEPSIATNSEIRLSTIEFAQ